jgi:1-deoxy-D-xylulose-5-phosphate reductoisomerase
MILLGSTGSIGVNTLEIAKRFNLDVEVLVAGKNYKLLNKQIEEFKPKYVVVKDKETAKKVNFKNILYGEKAILEVLEKAKSNLVVNALVGEAGLKPTLKAQELNKKIALANKESLVIAGKFIDTSKITPIDSEHFGLWYLLNGGGRKNRIPQRGCSIPLHLQEFVRTFPKVVALRQIFRPRVF